MKVSPFVLITSTLQKVINCEIKSEGTISGYTRISSIKWNRVEEDSSQGERDTTKEIVNRHFVRKKTRVRGNQINNGYDFISVDNSTRKRIEVFNNSTKIGIHRRKGGGDINGDIYKGNLDISNYQYYNYSYSMKEILKTLKLDSEGCQLKFNKGGSASTILKIELTRMNISTDFV